jgi:hypothetical protein
MDSKSILLIDAINFGAWITLLRAKVAVAAMKPEGFQSEGKEPSLI